MPFSTDVENELSGSIDTMKRPSSPKNVSFDSATCGTLGASASTFWSGKSRLRSTVLSLTAFFDRSLVATE